MATEVYTTDTIALQDGTEANLKPLPIARLRKFMRVWGEFLEYLQDNANKEKDKRDKDTTVSDKQFDVFTELVTISLASEHKGDKTDEAFKEWVEEVVDEPTIYRILDKCGGLNLTDPKLAELAAAAAASQGQAGTN